MSDEYLSDELFLVSPDGEGTKTLSFSRSPTVLLNFAANRFTRLASRDYQDRFGIGAMDWRMLVMMTRAPGCTVAQASRTIGIDKGAVSRSLARLEKAGLAQSTSNSSDVRRKSWVLTTDGKEMHDRILKIALERQRSLLKGFSTDDVDQLTTLLRRFLDNLDAIQEESKGH